MVDDWLNSWMRRKARPMPTTAQASAGYATRKRHAADLADKPPAGAPWQDVVKWLRERGITRAGQSPATE